MSEHVVSTQVKFKSGFHSLLMHKAGFFCECILCSANLFGPRNNCLQFTHSNGFNSDPSVCCFSWRSRSHFLLNSFLQMGHWNFLIFSLSFTRSSCIVFRCWTIFESRIDLLQNLQINLLKWLGSSSKNSIPCLARLFLILPPNWCFLRRWIRKAQA